MSEPSSNDPPWSNEPLEVFERMNRYRETNAPPVAMRPFPFIVCGARIHQEGLDFWHVQLDVAIEPTIGGKSYHYIRDEHGRARISFWVNVHAPSEAEAMYFATMMAFEHEMLEHLYTGNKLWCDPHDKPSPLAGRLPSSSIDVE